MRILFPRLTIDSRGRFPSMLRKLSRNNSTVRWCSSALKRTCLSSLAARRTRSSPVNTVGSLGVDPVGDISCSPWPGPFPPAAPFVRLLLGYYGPVRLLRRVHVRLSISIFPYRSVSLRHDGGLPVPVQKVSQRAWGL